MDKAQFESQIRKAAEEVCYKQNVVAAAHSVWT